MRASSIIHASSLLLLPYLSHVAATLPCSKSAIKAHVPENVTVQSATVVQAGGSYGGGSQDEDFPGVASNLPALCAVQMQVYESNSTYVLGVFLPSTDTYNNRMMTTGNTGFGGGINWPALGTFVHYGFAVMSTNSGHDSGPGAASWALNDPEAVLDWDYRAMHGSVVVAKQVIAAFYDNGISYSYYSACSGGGRQGLKEVQAYPADFDGVVAGSPPWQLTHLHPWVVQVGMWNLPLSGANRISAAGFSTIKNEVYAQCDPADGLLDGVISSPYTCAFNATKMACSKTKTSDCLQPGALATFETLYSDWRDPEGNFLFPPFALGADYYGLASGTSAPSDFGVDFVKYFVANDANWSWTTFNTTYVTQADQDVVAQGNADGYDMSSFESRGGKLIHYHGMADSLIPTGSSILFREKVANAMSAQDGDLDSFYRMFLIPGMGHCRDSTVAPWFIAGGGQGGLTNYTYSVPGFMDPKHDVVLAVMDWVENGTAPDYIIATKFAGDKNASDVVNQRPICAYPNEAKYSGSGNVNISSNWACQAAAPVSIPAAELGH